MDAGEEKDVASVVDEALQKYKRLDVFFANAGISISAERITEASGDKFDQVMRTNAKRYELHRSPLVIRVEYIGEPV